MWNQGENCIGRPAFRKSDKSMQPGLKHHGAHYVEPLFFDPWQSIFLLPKFPNPHQDACAQLCSKTLQIYTRMLHTMWTLDDPTSFTSYLSQRSMALANQEWHANTGTHTRGGMGLDVNVPRHLQSMLVAIFGRDPGEVQARTRRDKKLLKSHHLSSNISPACVFSIPFSAHILSVLKSCTAEPATNAYPIGATSPQPA
jgi:hypothetical protein